MIEIEIKSPNFRARDDDIVWDTVASLAVDGERHELHDPRGVIDFERQVLDFETGRALSWADDKEDWARHLGATYRGPELVAVVVRDSQDEAPGERLEQQPVVVPETSKQLVDAFARST